MNLPLENQVCSLDLAKRLKELGVKQESVFYWKQEAIYYWQKLDNKDLVSPSCFSAFTVAELGTRLWDIFEKHGWNLLYKAYGEVFNYRGTERIGELGIINLMRTPDMGAKMLIYLIEQGIINPKEL